MSEDIVQVAVGIITKSPNKVLISRRHAKAHQGGLWEFPGGKIESGETGDIALRRELKEELGIETQHTTPLSRIYFDYGDKRVCLNNYIISQFNGNPQGLEGQPIQWVDCERLSDYDFPAANVSIINQLQLPDYIQITGNFSGEEELLKKVLSSINSGIKLIHFRAHQLDDRSYIELAHKLKQLCLVNNIKLVLNRDSNSFMSTEADGMHLTAARMLELSKRPVPTNKLFSVSCHNEAELRHAEKLSADYIFLSPYKLARSHPSGTPLGAEKFSLLTSFAACPVYALGGLNKSNIDEIKSLGGNGVAAISEFWTNK